LLFSGIAVLLIISLSKPKGKVKNYFLITAIIILIIQAIILFCDKNNPVLISGRIAEYKELLSQIVLFSIFWMSLTKLENPNRKHQGQVFHASDTE
jgi:hypothetical protein